MPEFIIAKPQIRYQIDTCNNLVAGCPLLVLIQSIALLNLSTNSATFASLRVNAERTPNILTRYMNLTSQKAEFVCGRCHNATGQFWIENPSS